MTLKRWILTLLTLIVTGLVGSSLFGSLNEPQITDRLQLYQTDLLLQATEAQGDANLVNARTTLLGDDPFQSALEEYQSVRRSSQANLESLQARQKTLPPAAAPMPTDSQTRSASPRAELQQLKNTITRQQSLIDQLDLRIGVLQSKQNRTDEALKTWTAVDDRTSDAAIRQTANVLEGLWSDPPRLFPEAESKLQPLNGWFRDEALARLYDLQQRSDQLTALQATRQQTAQDTLVKLGLIGTAPAIGGLIGVVLLLGLVGQWLLRGKQSLLGEEGIAWNVPWNAEIVWQVLIVGFFFVGQVALPLLLGGLGLSFSAFGNRARALYSLGYYVLMATLGLTVLFLSIRSFRPLPDGWFRLTGKRNWLLWGVGGYLAALPLVLSISVLNQQIWQGQGGSNPLLEIVLEEGDTISLAIFFATAAIAAPIFEETLFRGFLLPSLTRYFPVWGAIVISSLIFAIAHLSLSEVLPLTVLGMVLGFVYARSRSLLASMLLHSLWNSVTMIGLLLLGNAASS